MNTKFQFVRRSLFVLIALVAVGAAFFIYRRIPPGSQSLRQSPAERVALLENGLRAIEDGDQSAPRDRWDPDYLQKQVGTNPDSILDWVRYNTTWIPYPGELRGPVGVLMDRRGNSLDRSLLLATLLIKAGMKVELAHTELPEAMARNLLPEAAAKGNVASTLEASSSSRLTAREYGLDTKLVQAKLEDQQDAVREFYSDLQSRVATQVSQLQSKVQKPDQNEDWAARAQSYVTALRDHWWVVVVDGGTERALDPMDLGAQTPTETFTVDALPDSLRHALTVRVIGERWSDGEVTKSTVLEQRVVPADLAAQEMILQFMPGSWPTHLDPDPNAELGLRGQALAQTEWGVVLSAGDKTLAQGAFDAHAKPKRIGGAGLHGLGGAIAGMAAPPSKDQSQLTAVWIEYEIHSPGSESRLIRRTVFDLFGAAARQKHDFGAIELDERKRLIRSLALMMRTEILPVAFRISPDFVSHLAAQSLLSNRKVLHILAENWSQPDQIDEDTLLTNASAGLSALYSLAIARQEWSRFRDQSFVNQINVITKHHHAGLTGNTFAIRGSVEIVAGDIGVSLAARDGFAVRQYQGVLDANADALWWTGEGLNNTSEAFNASPPSLWTTFSHRNIDEIDRLGLPDDARAQMKSDLDAGVVIVAPRNPVPRGPDKFVGWWRIDPVTGATNAIAGNGWGQCGSEYSVHLETAATGMRSWLFEYTLCQEIAQSINAFRTVGEELQKRGLWFWWVAPIKGQDMDAVFSQANKGCLISAMTAGFLATMPILLLRAEEASMEMVLADKAKNPGKYATLKSMPDQPGVSPKPKGNPAGFDPSKYVTEANPKKPSPTLPSIADGEGVNAKPKGNPTEGNPSKPPISEPETKPAPTKMPPTEPAPTQMPHTEPAPTQMPHTEPAPTQMPHTEPAPTQMPPTEAPDPSTVRNQPAPTEGGPSVSGEAPKTEPQLEPPKFDPDPRPPLSPMEELSDRARAAAIMEGEAYRADVEAGADYVRYKQNRPNPGRGQVGDPNYDYELENQKDQKWAKAHEAYQAAVAESRAAQRALAEAQAAQRRGPAQGGLRVRDLRLPAVAPRPNVTGCPPNCGNNGGGGAGNNLAVGSSAISSALPFPPVTR